MAKTPEPDARKASERQGCGDHRRGARNRARDRGGSACPGRARRDRRPRRANSRARSPASSAPARSDCRSTSPAARASPPFWIASSAIWGPSTCSSTTPGSQPTGEFAREPDAVDGAGARRQRRRDDARLQARARAHAAAGERPHRQRLLGAGAYAGARDRDLLREQARDRRAHRSPAARARGHGPRAASGPAEPDRDRDGRRRQGIAQLFASGKPEDVADAIVDVLQTGRPEAYVPAAARLDGRSGGDHASAGGEAVPPSARSGPHVHAGGRAGARRVRGADRAASAGGAAPIRRRPSRTPRRASPTPCGRAATAPSNRPIYAA